MRIEKSNLIFSSVLQKWIALCCNGHEDRSRNAKPHVYERNLFATDPSSLKYIQIESVIFLACNYFHIIYRFSRAQKQKLKNIVKFMPYIRRTDGVRKTFTWDQMNKFQVSWRKKLSIYNKCCYFSFVPLLFSVLVCPISKEVSYFLCFGKYSPNSSWVRAAGEMHE